MPATYVGQGQYRVSCNDCDASVTVHGAPRASSVVMEFTYGSRERTNVRLGYGVDVTDAFTWDRNGERFYSICKACKTARVTEARRQWREREGRAERAPIATTPNLARRFGVEIECISPVSHRELQRALGAEGLTGWRVKYDGSLPAGGAEIVSPPLAGDDGIDQVRKACRVLRRQGCTVDRRCGLHVHHEIRDMTIQQVRALAHLWADNQDVIDGLVAPSRRNGRNTFCGRLTATELDRLDRVTSLERLGWATDSRYKTLNLDSYGRYGTVEIRQHQGTLDAEKIVSWMQFGQAMIEQSRCATAFVSHRATELVTGLVHLDETPGTFLLGRAVRFGAVAI